MKNGVASTAGRDLQALFEAGSLGGLSDGQLLDRFIARREEAVFEAIIHRHGPMVWGVCRRVLRDHHDAEDAFQAAFLILARKPASVNPRDRLGNWLYGVAYQTARKARAMRTRRRVREGRATDIPEPEAVGLERPDDRRDELDRELSRLPEKYRIPVVLCELEGLTHREAAERLGWPIGTVSGRLSRARAMLTRRLSRRAVPSSGVSPAVLGAGDSESAHLPTHLIGPTARAASMAAGRAVEAGVVSAEVVTLMEGVLKMMRLSRLKIPTAALAVGLALAVGGTSFAFRAHDPGPPAPERVGEPTEVREVHTEGTQAGSTKPQVVPEKAQDRPIDPMASYAFKLDSDEVYELPELRVEYRNFHIEAGPVSVVPISSEPGITGAMVVGKGTFRYIPEEGKAIEGQFRATMLRFNPEEWARIVPIEKGKKVSDRGVTEMSRQMLQVAIRHCWQSNKEGGRIQEVLIPPKGAFAAVLYSKEHGDLLISFDDRRAAVYNFTERKDLYEKE